MNTWGSIVVLVILYFSVNDTCLLDYKWCNTVEVSGLQIEVSMKRAVNTVHLMKKLSTL